MYYLKGIGEKLKRKISFYGHIDRRSLDSWWDEKNYCLSTSLTEGNPNNVLEAMAKGIKPIVHAWPGAEDQFDVFYSAREAAAEILRGSYNSAEYLNTVKQNHSVDNYKEAIRIAMED